MRVIVLVSLIAVFVGCSKPATKQVPSDVLATVGERSIDAAQWNAEVDRRQVAGQTLPDKDQLLEELIQREALLARALELGMDKTPEIRRRYENLLIAELKERELKPQLEQAAVGPEDVRNAVHQAQRRQPAQVRIAVLQLTANSRASENKRTQLAERLIEAREKALRMPTHESGFGGLAVDYSDDQTTRYTGGDKGWFDVGNTNYSIAPEILTAANSLPKVGDVSDVIRADRGLYLVRLMDRRAAGTTSLTAQEPAVQQKLLTKERKRIETEFGSSIRSKLRVEVNTPAFAAVQYQTSTSMAQNGSIPPALP